MAPAFRFGSVLLVLTAQSLVQGQLITYRLVDGAAGDQAGHTLEGTITLDPSCASSCTSLHAWEYTISGPTLNRSASSNQFAPFFRNFSGLFEATPEALTVNYDVAPGGTSAGGLELIMDLAGLAWNVASPPGSQPHREYFAYDFGVTVGQAGWAMTPQAQTITIATAIPEPSIGSIALLLATLACLRATWNKIVIRRLTHEADGNLILSSAARLRRWRVHFESALLDSA